MSRVCQVTGKGPKTGNTVSHANNRKRRRFLPNLHTHRFWSETEKRFLSLRVSTRGLRTIEKRGVDVVVSGLRAKGVKVLGATHARQNQTGLFGRRAALLSPPPGT